MATKLQIIYEEKKMTCIYKKTIKIYLSAIAMVILSGMTFAEDYILDKRHTRIGWTVNHHGFSDFPGYFKEFSGYIILNKSDWSSSKIEVVIDASSITTFENDLDTKLIGEKIFSVMKYPNIHFISRNIEMINDTTGEIKGDLTFLGITKKIVLNFKKNRVGVHPVTKEYVAGFSATGTINRSEWGLHIYLPSISDEVQLNIQVEAILKK